MKNNIAIVSIDKDQDLLPEVIALGDSQRKFLGFLPEGAFADFARRGWILLAKTAANAVVGYAAYRMTQNAECHLVHLCVDPDCRNEGIGTKLLTELKRRTSSLYRVILRCRRDYKLEPFWQANGFSPIGEVPGRANFGTILTVWEYVHHPRLFAFQKRHDVEHVVVDINVVIAAHFENNLECQALFSDVSASRYVYCISKYSFAEANSSQDAQQRRRTRGVLAGYERVELCGDMDILSKVKEIVGQRNNDANQIASSIYSGAKCFITLDAKLYQKRDAIFNIFGLNIVTPTEFIVNFDSSLGGKYYSPAFTPFSNIVLADFDCIHEDDLFERYANSGERKADFRSRLACATKVDEGYYCKNIVSRNTEIGVCSGVIERDALVINLFRIKKELPHRNTITVHVVENIVRHAMALGVARIKCVDASDARDIESLLLEAGFIPVGDQLVKILAKGLLRDDEADRILLQYTDRSILAIGDSDAVRLDVEKYLWPAKLASLSLPVYVIPIKPGWAQKLLTPNGFHHLLFDDTVAMEQCHRVYYRSAKGINIKSPARIVWYVTSGKGGQPGKFVVGVSLLTSVVVDSAKKLFKEYKRLGVYEWKDLRAHFSDEDDAVMALQFSRTEIFPKRIMLKDFQSIVKANDGKELLTVAPSTISHASYQDVYRIGFSCGN